MRLERGVAFFVVYLYIQHRELKRFVSNDVRCIKWTQLAIISRNRLFKSNCKAQAKWHQEHGPVLGYFIGNISAFAVADAQMVRQIEIKDFIDFTDRPSWITGAESGIHDDALTFFDAFDVLKRQRWKRVRSKLTPSFTSNELKTVITSFVFLGPLASIMRWLAIRVSLRRQNAAVNPFAALRTECKRIVAARRANASARLLKTEIVDNAFLILLAGYETTSSSLAFITKELLRFPDVQGRFRDELIQLTTNGQVFDFECLQRCQCMVAVIQETLRMNPPTCGELTYQTYPNL
ncbi:LOW QUALITY PROTEIN: probable cytochrome P450 6a14 [Varroa jacobsoni]|uniref:LOW QUALITY PROTEIN: probable cytochrome P450 6a14 n=1 Tax=Varroa jacobsoni TaxID=62625 RepID=UPI000BF41927|nr:LOW QUALITY PROTEIN: probable cytochrome P450 6a14 [Varroa jacobsoni]